jgi:hypothetical protein
VRGPPWLARQQRAQSERAACSRRQAQGWTASRLACSSRGASAAQPLRPASLKVPRHEGESAHYVRANTSCLGTGWSPGPAEGPARVRRSPAVMASVVRNSRSSERGRIPARCCSAPHVAMSPSSASAAPAHILAAQRKGLLAVGPGHEMMRGTRRGWPLSAQRPCSASAPSSRGTLQKRRGSSLLALPRVYTHPHPPSLSPPPSLDPSTATLEPIVALSHRVDVRPLSVHFRHSLILGVLASLNPHPPQPTDAAIYHYHFHYYCYCHYH